jgi:hypothetical protein
VIDPRPQLFGKFFNSLEFLIQVFRQDSLRGLVHCRWNGLCQVCKLTGILSEFCGIGALPLADRRRYALVELRFGFVRLMLSRGLSLVPITVTTKAEEPTGEVSFSSGNSLAGETNYSYLTLTYGSDVPIIY